MLTLLAALFVYWGELDASHERMRAQAKHDTQRMASQTAAALSQQVYTVVRTLDYFSRHLGWMWRNGTFQAFDGAALSAMRTLPPDALVQVAVADTEGRIRYSRLHGDPDVLPLRPRVSIYDREHFRVHVDAESPFLFISSPIKGRISQQWTIQFTRGIWNDGEFQGVMVLAVSADYLATAFKRIFPDSTDAASLVKSDGMYLTRSYHLDKIIGGSLPSNRPFIQQPELDHGTYEVDADVDATRRFYSWHRVDNLPLVVLVGIGADKAMDVTESAIANSRWQSWLGSGLLLLTALTVSVLWVQGGRRSADLRVTAEELHASRAQLRVTLDAVKDGTWKFNHHRKEVEWDDRVRNMLGHRERATYTLAEIMEMTHTADQPALMREGAKMLSPAAGEVMSLQVRLRKGDGRWLWVLARGRVIEWDMAGKPLHSVGTLSDISEYVAETNLRDALLSRSAAAILLVSPTRRMVNANARFASIFLKPGQQPEDLDLRDLHVDEAHWQEMGEVYKLIRKTGQHQLEFPFRDARGHVRWMEAHGVLQDPDDSQSNIIWTWIDITQRKEADAALAVETLRLNTLLETFPGGVLIEDSADTVVFVNPAWPQLLGMHITSSQLIGMHDRDLRALLGPKVSGWLRSPHGESPEARRSHEILADTGRHLEIEHVEIRQYDQYLGSVWLLRDITERKQHELELAQQASTDALTGLPNRRSFMQRLNDLYDVAVATRASTGVVMMVDIDHFKRVNDTYGHAVGDVVLEHIARIMLSAVRGNDMAARLGGEEFAILLPYTGLAPSLEIAERVRQSVEESTVDTGGHSIRITVSLGLSAVSEHHSPDTALQQADEALYQAKAGGRNRVKIWDGLSGALDNEA